MIRRGAGFYRGCSRVDAWLRRAMDGVAALLLLSVTLLGIAQVFSRYVLNDSLIWSEEGIRLLYVWLVLIAASTAPHMTITWLSDRLTGHAAQLLSIGQSLVVLGCLFILVQGALQLNASFGNDRYVALGLTKRWYWSAAIVGGVLWAGTWLSARVLSPGQSRH